MTDLLRYEQIFPQKEQLKKLIKLYYTHCSEHPDRCERITYYPNYTVTLNIYRHSKVVWDKFSRTHNPDKSRAFEILLVSKFDRSREIVMQGKFDKLSIVFHPLGFNHFISAPLSGYARDHFSFFDAFGETFNQLLDRVFATPDLSIKRELLDDFFLHRLLGFPENRLSYAVARIMATQGQVPIGQLASELNISRKTLFRLFKQHLAYAPSEYRSIVKFREALNAYQHTRKKPKLSTLAYAARYYDQSDLNFHFKTKTGQTPAQLFTDLQTVEPGLYWTLTNVPKVQDKG